MSNSLSNGSIDRTSTFVRPHYDPDARRWMVQLDKFRARPATDREVYEVVQARLVSAVKDAAEWIGADGVELMVEATLHG